MSQRDQFEDAIVVGVDGSPSSQAALRWAAFEGAALDCEVVAIQAWLDVIPSNGMVVAGMFTDQSWDPALEAEKSLVATVDEVFGEHRPLRLSAMVRAGGAAEVLLAESRGARLLVLGSRGHGGFRGMLLGSVSSACAEHATCPVLVVHGDRVPARADGSVA
ncbi:nucleotide-binding universal stress UspA family protein [Motilibacter rhizosphaerae]|uniref:Nucleotide-binding universal stress UspA family protein n=1 Tax=Motilibacter rhizosphaerae TaxID=598652 RepID=A0A4Q7NWN9_9ACTN|nr:universal stress protein [Motilibacter rhizosphaerae]RZS91635.1 nucleotide-binding universal stress UspA family protein [Motilibacter rhizosphaerae]